MKLTRSHFQLLMSAYMNLAQDEIAEKIADPDTPVLEVIIGRVIQKAIFDGDDRKLEFICNRLIGPVQVEQEHTVRHFIIDSDEKQIKMVSEEG